MGLLKAIGVSINSTLSDQWKEYFYCDAIANDCLVTKGIKQTGKRSQNTKGNDNVISNGSGIAVADGQCMVIVEGGKVIELSAEPGVYTFDKSSESSIFYGGLGKGIVGIFKTIGKRIAYGGDVGNDQRVYYFNLKEILDNKFGTQNPVPFRVVDSNIGLDLDSAVRCFGTFSYKITNPLLFYKNICGNITKDFKRSEIDSQIKLEFISALQPAFGKLSNLEIRPNQVVSHIDELKNAMNESLSELWRDNRGIEVVSVAIGSITLPDDDMTMIKEIQRKAVYRNTGMAAATMVEAQAEALKNAAANKNGTMAGFMGLNFAQNATGINAKDLFAMNNNGNNNNNGAYKAGDGSKVANEVWTCPTCGSKATGKFCPECGAKKPSGAVGWICSTCGTVNKGKFCSECGAKKPANEPLYKCDKCGWEPEDPKNPPKFCPECGDPFDENDIK